MATEIIGLSHSEREMIAYTVKFNTSPFVYYTGVGGRKADLSKEEYLIIAKMTAILRIVNAMDRTHRQKCKDVTVALKDHELRVTVASQRGSFPRNRFLSGKNGIFRGSIQCASGNPAEKGIFWGDVSWQLQILKNRSIIPTVS